MTAKIRTVRRRTYYEVEFDSIQGGKVVGWPTTLETARREAQEWKHRCPVIYRVTRTRIVAPRGKKGARP